MDKVCYSKRHREKATEWFADEEFSKFMSLSNIFISSSLLKDFFFLWWVGCYFYFNPFKRLFHCLLASIVSLERSTNNLKADNVKVSFFFPCLIALKIFFLVCGFQYLHLLWPLFLLLYLVWNLFGFLNMCLLKSFITFNKFFIIDSSALFTFSRTSKTFDETYARLDYYVLCRIHSIYCFPSLYLCPSLWTELFSVPWFSFLLNIICH